MILVGLVAFGILGACGSVPSSDDLSVPADLDRCPGFNISSGPVPTTECSGGDVCYYFEAQLFCLNGAWEYCWDGLLVQCPSQAPIDGADCGVGCQSANCSYGCADGVTQLCRCNLNRWHCSTMACGDGGAGDGG